MPEITPADVLTPAGFVTTAAIVTGLVEVLVRLVGFIRGYEQQAAAVLAAVFVVAAVAVQVSEAPPADVGAYVGTFFTAVLAWYGILRIAMGIHDDVAQKPNSLTGPTVQA